MSKHTPGPWESCEAGRSGYWIAGDKHPFTVVLTIDEEGRFGAIAGDNAEANARLIAAAPELLDALRAMLEGEGAHSVGCKEYPPGFDDSRCCPVRIARAAIAKATGSEA